MKCLLGENYHPEMEIDENEDATANDSDDDNDDFTQQEADYVRILYLLTLITSIFISAHIKL